MPIARAVREGLELLEIRAGVAEATGGETPSRALPPQLGEARAHARSRASSHASASWGSRASSRGARERERAR